MIDAGGRDPALGKPLHPFPGRPTSLTAAAQRAAPQPDDLKTERAQGTTIHRHTVVTHVPNEHRLQPLPDLGDGIGRRRRSSVFTSCSLACNLERIVCRSTVNRPLLLFFPQMCVKPRKSKVSGFPCPRPFRFPAANGPNSISPASDNREGCLRSCEAIPQTTC